MQSIKTESEKRISTYYVALFVMNEIAGGIELREVTADDYFRARIPATPECWYLRKDGTLCNRKRIVFPPTKTDWGRIVGFGIYDSPHKGHLLSFGLLTVSMRVPSGSTVTFRKGELTPFN